MFFATIANFPILDCRSRPDLIRTLAEPWPFEKWVQYPEGESTVLTWIQFYRQGQKVLDPTTATLFTTDGY